MAAAAVVRTNIPRSSRRASLPEDTVTTPRPDPTERTTEQLLQAVAASREIIETRLGGMDEAVVLLRTQTDKLPAYVTREVDKLQELVEAKLLLQQEKFKSISQEFALRDANLDKALTAAKELVSVQQISNDRANQKMEAGFEKRIEGTSDVIAKTSENLSDKISSGNDRMGSIETRVVALESSRSGVREQRSDNNTSQTMLIAIIGAVLLAVQVLLHFAGVK